MENDATTLPALALDDGREYLMMECARLGMSFEKAAVISGLSPEEEDAARNDGAFHRRFLFNSAYREKELRETLFGVMLRNVRKGTSVELRYMLDELRKKEMIDEGILPLDSAGVTIFRLPDNGRQ